MFKKFAKNLKFTVISFAAFVRHIDFRYINTG